MKSASFCICQATHSVNRENCIQMPHSPTDIVVYQLKWANLDVVVLRAVIDDIYYITFASTTIHHKDRSCSLQVTCTYRFRSRRVNVYILPVSNCGEHGMSDGVENTTMQQNLLSCK